jgi:hypothetical protein
MFSRRHKRENSTPNQWKTTIGRVLGLGVKDDPRNLNKRSSDNYYSSRNERSYSISPPSSRPSSRERPISNSQGGRSSRVATRYGPRRVSRSPVQVVLKSILKPDCRSRHYHEARRASRSPDHIISERWRTSSRSPRHRSRETSSSPPLIVPISSQSSYSRTRGRSPVEISPVPRGRQFSRDRSVRSHTERALDSYPSSSQYRYRRSSRSPQPVLSDSWKPHSRTSRYHSRDSSRSPARPVSESRNPHSRSSYHHLRRHSRSPIEYIPDYYPTASSRHHSRGGHDSPIPITTSTWKPHSRSSKYDSRRGSRSPPHITSEPPESPMSRSGSSRYYSRRDLRSPTERISEPSSRKSRYHSRRDSKSPSRAVESRSSNLSRSTTWNSNSRQTADSRGSQITFSSPPSSIGRDDKYMPENLHERGRVFLGPTTGNHDDRPSWRDSLHVEFGSERGSYDEYTASAARNSQTDVAVAEWLQSSSGSMATSCK